MPEEAGGSGAEAGARRGGGALAVGAGILASRISGLVRSALLGSFLGVGPHADVLAAAFRLPNLIQNLLGEQTLSAAFIPIYSRLLAQGRREEAGRFAAAVFALLAAVAGAIALLGVLLARPIVGFFAVGFLRDRELVASGLAAVDRFPLAVAAVQWIFPMTALLVLSAWALGVRNSHGRFLLSYAAPVLWNAAIVAAVIWAASAGVAASAERLLLAACAGALGGGALQLAIQLPGALREIERFDPRPGPVRRHLREAIAAFLPTVAGRGVVQLSSYLDQILASLLVAGAVGALAYAQTLYLLPVSLFGLSVAAASLPELSRRLGRGETESAGRHLKQSLGQAAYLNLPAAVAYLLLGLPFVEGIYRGFGGRFGAEDAVLVYLTLASYSLGLPAATEARVLQSALYAGGDARTPARWAATRVAIAVALGVPAMLLLDRVQIGSLSSALGLGAASAAATGEPAAALRLGALGLALAASVAAWVERFALRRAAGERWGRAVAATGAARYLAFAVLAAVAPLALVLSGALDGSHPALRAILLAGVFGAGYLALTRKEEPGSAIWSRLARRGSR